MSVFKKLAGETALYGLSSILARFVNFLLVPLHTTVLDRGDYGVIGQMYGWIALVIVIYSFRLESAYFRFASNDLASKSYPNAKIFTLSIALLFSGLLILFSTPIAAMLQVSEYTYLIKYVAGIIALDALCELPFARLRLQKRPVKFVVIKSINISVNVLLNVYFLLWHPGYHTLSSSELVAYVFIANLMVSALTLLLLFKEYLAEGFQLNIQVMKQIFLYSWPLLIVGIANIIDDAMSRQFMSWLLPGSMIEKKTLMGEYNACIKFAVLISLFVQAFRYAAEPFFFKHMNSSNAKSDYSKITTYFTQFLMIGFVAILLYLDFFKHYIVKRPEYLNAIGIVPIVLMANVFLGIYYNVSNWYRLTDRTRYGMYSALIGVGLTIFFNILLVPRYSYYGTAWSMLICYFGMTVVTYIWGQKYYPIAYELNKIARVVVGGLFIYILSVYITQYIPDVPVIRFIARSLLLVVYLWLFNLNMIKAIFLSLKKGGAS